MRERLLEEGEEKKEAPIAEAETPKEETDPKKKWKNPEVLKLDLNAVIPLGEFQTEIAEPGIDLFENGALSKFDPAYENIYEQIKKASDDALKGKSGDGEEGEGEEGAADGTKTAFIALTSLLNFLLLF